MHRNTQTRAVNDELPDALRDPTQLHQPPANEHPASAYVWANPQASVIQAVSSTSIQASGIQAASHRAISSTSASTSGGQHASTTTGSSALADGSGPRKRPLNAFMAFRTYYLKMFPCVEQKTVSGYLTTLWSREPQRNKWALIAKVYSFVRDHLKGRVNLSAFLGVCCPAMQIVDPAEYLTALGWEMNDGMQRVPGFVPVNDSHGDPYPTSEIELLACLVGSGYLAELGPALVEIMSQSTNGMTIAGAVPLNDAKAEFIAVIDNSPYEAAEQLLGVAYDDAYFQRMLVHAWAVDHLGNFSFVPITIPYPPSGEVYPFYNDGRAGVPASMPFDQDLTAEEIEHHRRVSSVAGGWYMDDSYMVEYFEDGEQ